MNRRSPRVSALTSFPAAKETVAATGSSVLNKAVGIVPASVMNTATNVLRKSILRVDEF